MGCYCFHLSCVHIFFSKIENIKMQHAHSHTRQQGKQREVEREFRKHAPNTPNRTELKAQQCRGRAELNGRMETRSALDAIGAGECPTECDNDARHTQAPTSSRPVHSRAALHAIVGCPSTLLGACLPMGGCVEVPLNVPDFSAASKPNTQKTNYFCILFCIFKGLHSYIYVKG